MDNKDRRRSQRLKFDVIVEILFDKETISGHLTDISEHGACCVMNKEIPLLKEFQIKILNALSKPLHLPAISVRKEITPTKKEYLFGFDFKSSKKSSELLELLKAYA